MTRDQRQTRVGLVIRHPTFVLGRGAAMSDPIISPDTRRDERLPPGQVLTRKWPVLHAGETPHYPDLAPWDFFVFGEVKEKKRFTWAEFSSWPRVQVHADMHCVTRWSKLDNLWEGVTTCELLMHVEALQ